MCGIVGVVSQNNEPESFKQIELSINKLNHRGPDFKSHVNLPHAVLGHTRLSIIDTSSGANQPFTDKEKRFFLIYNGEIFNFQELKKQLSDQGVQFHTESDTEVVFHHLIKHGKAGLKDFNGFFALAFYDVQEKELLLARDRMGIKPLYFSEREKELCFSSEIQALLPLLQSKKVDQEVAFQYLLHTYTPNDTTCLESVKKINPGHYLLWNSKAGITEYQAWQREKRNFTPETNIEQLIEDAVLKRLVADVPLGSFLSGGIDSSIVSYVAQKHIADLNTYSVGFENQSIDETPYAEEVAEHLGTQHHKVMVREEDFENEIDQILNSFDEPFGDSSAVAMYFLCKEASKKLKVALSGDGADELLGGYKKHLAEWKARNSRHLFQLLQPVHLVTKNKQTSRESRWGNLSRKVNRFMELKNLSPEERYSFLARFNQAEDVSPLMLEQFPADHIYQTSDKNWNNDFNLFLLEDQRNILPNDMLKKVDLMSMRHSMEVRPVFLDDVLVDYCRQLPLNKKIDGKKGKIILRETYQKYLPQNVFSRKKQGFEIPLESWMRKLIPELRQRDYFRKDFIDQQHLWNFNNLNLLLDQFEKGEKKHANLIWSVLVYQHWYSRTMI